MVNAGLTPFLTALRDFAEFALPVRRATADRLALAQVEAKPPWGADGPGAGLDPVDRGAALRLVDLIVRLQHVSNAVDRADQVVGAVAAGIGGGDLPPQARDDRFQRPVSDVLT